jgi:hypothetical protein
MSASDFLVFATISAAVMCWAAAEILRSRLCWTAGALLALIHSLAAFGVFYGWSHETAREMTMKQTFALTGVRFGGGIYVNYLFLVVWLSDVVWWWTSPATYEGRPRAVSRAIRGFMLFIIVNGAVIFADGLARVIGVSAVLLVVLSRIPRR